MVALIYRYSTILLSWMLLLFQQQQLLIEAMTLEPVIDLFKIEECGDKRTNMMQFNVTLKNTTYGDMVKTGVVKLDVELGNNINVLVTNGQNHKPILKQMVSFCDFLRNHVGEFANQVQRAAGMKEGCPIAPGTYNFKSFLVSLKTFKSLRKIPLGDVNIVMQFLDKGSKGQISCIDIKLHRHY